MFAFILSLLLTLVLVFVLVLVLVLVTIPISLHYELTTFYQAGGGVDTNKGDRGRQAVQVYALTYFLCTSLCPLELLASDLALSFLYHLSTPYDSSTYYIIAFPYYLLTSTS